MVLLLTCCVISATPVATLLGIADVDVTDVKFVILKRLFSRSITSLVTSGVGILGRFLSGTPVITVPFKLNFESNQTTKKMKKKKKTKSLKSRSYNRNRLLIEFFFW